MPKPIPAVELTQIATPATPASGSVSFYVKSDNVLYMKTSAGTEVEVNAVVTWPTGTEPSLTGIPTGTLWVEYTP